MSGIKYYQLKEDEELPDEFCAVKDVNGEPSEYTFYRPETENAKLRELCADMWAYITEPVSKRNNLKERFARLDDIGDRLRELGVEVDA